MARTETQEVTNQRREALLYLTLIENSACEARKCLCLSDELAEAARVPSLVLAGRGSPQSGQEERRARANELGVAAHMQLNELMHLCGKLQRVLKPEKQEN